MNTHDISKIVVYPSGEMLDKAAVRDVVCAFWNLSENEKICFLKTVEMYPTSQDIKTLTNE